MTPRARPPKDPRKQRSRWRPGRRSGSDIAAPPAPSDHPNAEMLSGPQPEDAEADPLGSLGAPESPQPPAARPQQSPAAQPRQDPIGSHEPGDPGSDDSTTATEPDVTGRPATSQGVPPAAHTLAALPTPDEVVAATIARWRTELLELAGGSALWDIDALGDALVELTAAHPSGIAQLFAGRRTRLSNLAREGSALTQARRHARIVSARADDLAQRFGITPTYVAMGVASWFMPEEGAQPVPDFDPSPMPGRTVHVPVLLRPVQMTHPAGSSDIELELDPQAEINAVLVRALRMHGVQIDPALLVDSTNRDHGFSPRPALDVIATLGRALPQFTLDSRIVLGTFIHPGQALADDVAAQESHLADHEAIRALAGDPEPMLAAARPSPAMRLSDPDPDQERGVGDLGAGQHRVLDAAAGGGHLFIDAPPGADVPGTIAALMAQAVAAGQHVVYVPGTHRAGAATRATLRELGLGDLVLDLAGESDWRKQAATRLIDGLNPHAPDIDPKVADERERLRRARASLGDYIAALHTPREPWQASAYHALQALAELTSARPGPRTQVRLGTGAVRSLDDTDRARLRARLIEAAKLGAFHLRASDTPWYGARLRSTTEATEAMVTVRSVLETLPTLRGQVAATAAQTGLDDARTLRGWADQLELLDGIRRSLDVFVPEVFERSADDMVAATASRQWREQHGSTLSATARRRLRKQARDMVRPGVVVDDLHAELARAAQRRGRWREQSSGGGWPRLPEAMATILTTNERMSADIAGVDQVLSPTVGGRELVDVPLAELAAKFSRLAADEATLEKMPQRAGIIEDLTSEGLGGLVEDLSARRVATALVGPEFDLAWWSSVLEEMLNDDPAMVGLEAEALSGALTGLRRLDLAQTESLRDPILRAHAGRVRDAIGADRPRAQDFYRSVKRGEADLRTLLDRFGRVAWAPRPLWIVPPMVVPQILPVGRDVDVVIVDAVAHLGVEQLIPALSRARQVIVVGDGHRRGSRTLTTLGVLPRVDLPSDRVDRDIDIAAFLAAHGYADVIRPVPSPPRPSQVGLHTVDGSGMPAPGSDAVESVQEEIDRVVDLVIDHALTRPEESLAVIALNTRHADRIREAVALTAAGSPAVADFFDPEAPEAFSVVGVESVAGLRRDAVIVSVGYGKTPHGRILHRFGAVSGPDGEGLLVDTIDACRHRLTVVACMNGGELDPHRLRSAGANMLRDLLLFAEAGRMDEPNPPGSQVAAPDRLLVDLAERLWRLGLVVVPRYGRPDGVRIPLAIGHPSVPGELLIAVVTDDPDYVAEPSLRRRDRHWVDRLTTRGWRVHTVFSSALFMDPQGAAERIAAAVGELVADRGLGGPDPAVALTPPPAYDDEEELADAVSPEATSADGTPGSAAVDPVRVSARGERIAGTTTSSLPRIVTPGVRSERPQVEPGLPVSGYSDDQLDAMVAWLASDGRDRVAEQYVAELRAELGLTRRSAHVGAVLASAVTRASVAADRPVDDPPDDCVEESGEDPVPDPVTGTVDDPADESVGDPARGSADEGAADPVVASADGPSPEGAQRPDRPSAGGSAGESGDEDDGSGEEPRPEGRGGPVAHQPAFDGLAERPADGGPDAREDSKDAPGPGDGERAPSSRHSRRAGRRGSEDPQFHESDWRADPASPTGVDDERILREKPPHWG